MNVNWRPWWRAGLDLLFPPHCLGCGEGLASSLPPLFCPDCREKIIPLTPPFCSCCGRPLPDAAGQGHVCGRCLAKPPAFARARALLLYAGPVAEAIHRFKYQGETCGLATFAHFHQSAPPDLAASDCILPVPLHKKRLRERGFNQAQLLAAALFPGQRQRLHPDLLRRVRHTAPQTGMNGRERRRNLRGAFAVSRPEKIRGQRVLLVDDVYTTGSTVNECATILRRAGAAAVEVLTLARVRE
ncbi:MAG: ComF family protein [Thermodesulfobacteriota bacterium]